MRRNHSYLGVLTAVQWQIYLLLVLQIISKKGLYNSFKQMEAHKSFKSNDGPPSHRQLTPIRIVSSLLCLLVLLLTAFMMLVCCFPFTAIVIRFFSVHYSRKATSFCFGAWLALWPFLFEKINKTKVIFSGEPVPSRERVLLIANHRTEVDWMYLWAIALRKRSLGYIKYVLKSSLMKLPVFGWSFHILDFISVERKWEVDASKMRQMLSTFTDPRDPMWLAVFPEGTDYTEQKCMRSQKYAAEKGLPVLKNVLLPKTKGFHACLDTLRSSLDAVYDVTIGYRHRCPTLMDSVYGVDPSEVHIHIRRIPLNKIPISEEETAAWLMNTFELKDHLLSDFKAKGQFPCQGTEGDLPMVKCLVNVIVVISLTSLGVFLLFFSVWFRAYVTLACAFLSTVTYFNIRPSPVTGIVKKKFSRRNQSCE